jgi:hypothetical protein
MINAEYQRLDAEYGIFELGPGGVGLGAWSMERGVLNSLQFTETLNALQI